MAAAKKAGTIFGTLQAIPDIITGIKQDVETFTDAFKDGKIEVRELSPMLRASADAMNKCADALDTIIPPSGG